MVAAIAVLVFGAAWVLNAAGVEPVPTWFYVFAWYPVLLLLDSSARRRDGRPSLFADPWRVTSLGCWSVAIWLVFEAANFQLHNWYYVFLPSAAPERWAGIVLSFATVVPAVVLVERWLASRGVGRRWRSRPVRARPWEVPATAGIGVAMAGGALLLPNLLFPLIWGAAWLIVDPIVHRRRPEWSLLRDIERGEWGRIGRLMLGGVLIGLLWEFFNHWARARWIYTVPWLEHTKLFEMPPIGFLGFPFFALEAWAMYHALCVLGLAIDPTGVRVAAPRFHRVLAALVGGAIAVAVLLGMGRWTISSTTPRLMRLPGVTASEVRAMQDNGYHSVFRLADADESGVAAATGLPPDRAAAIIDLARLVSLRGIGTEHAAELATIGVRTVCQLARRSPGPLWGEIQTAREQRLGVRRAALRPTPPEVRVWVGAARRACTAAHRVTVP
jgi:hypothetical protein